MIAVENLVKRYNSHRVLDGVCHAQQRGEAVVIIGPSGCGKSTFLRCLNQLETPDSGRISINGTTIVAGRDAGNGKDEQLRRELRLSAGMVFQSFNLFPHLTALENVTEAPVVVKGEARSMAEARALELLAK